MNPYKWPEDKELNKQKTQNKPNIGVHSSGSCCWPL